MFLTCISRLATAADWHVEQDGSGDASTIEEAIELASEGDTIYIGIGTFYEANLWREWKTLSFVGSGSSDTWIDGSTSTSGGYLLGAVGGLVRGIGFRNLLAGYGVAVDGQAAFATRIEDCAFEDLGTALSVMDTPDLVVSGSTFQSNSVAIALEAMSPYGLIGTATVANNLFLGNAYVFDTGRNPNGPRGNDWAIINNTMVGNDESLHLQVGAENLWYVLRVEIEANVIEGDESGIEVRCNDLGGGFSGTVEGNLLSPNLIAPELYTCTSLAISNTLGDPMFQTYSDDGTWSNDDFHLRWGTIENGRSPGIDLASWNDYTPADDHDGTARPLDGDLDGVPMPDAGAFEANPDVDGDGDSASAAGGGDCDDANPSIHVGAYDICGDGIDQDCDGADEACSDTGGLTDSAEDSGSLGTPPGTQDSSGAEDADTMKNGGCSGCASTEPGWRALLLFAFFLRRRQ